MYNFCPPELTENFEYNNLPQLCQQSELYFLGLSMFKMMNEDDSSLDGHQVYVLLSNFFNAQTNVAAVKLTFISTHF